MDVTLHPMHIADYDEAFALWQATEGIGLSSADSREAVARYLEHNPGLSFVARGAGGCLVGAALCGQDGRRGYLHHVAVTASRRGQGIGRALVERCLAALRAEGIEKCHIFVFRDNETGQGFWENTGWYERTTLMIMSKDL